jgi:DNA-binding NarL/FixJ family response regulator
MGMLVEGVGVEVVGKTTDRDDAVALIEQHRPDLFIAGIDVMSSDELECVRRATAVHPGVRAVVLSDRTDREAVNAAFTAGARVYCVKTAEQGDVAAAIRQALEQSIYLAASGGPELASRPASTPAAGAHDLTRREIEILRLVAEGHSNSQLAALLWVSEQTVKFHLSNIYRKLDVANRTEASRWAQINGLLSAERTLDAPTAA